MGGGSSINYQAANRGTPDDYNEWDEMGATGWDGTMSFNIFASSRETTI